MTHAEAKDLIVSELWNADRGCRSEGAFAVAGTPILKE